MSAGRSLGAAFGRIFENVNDLIRYSGVKTQNKSNYYIFLQFVFDELPCPHWLKSLEKVDEKDRMLVEHSVLIMNLCTGHDTEFNHHLLRRGGVMRVDYGTRGLPDSHDV